MKKTIIAVAVSLVVVGAFAQNAPDLNNPHLFHARGYTRPGGGGANNLVYHTGGATITTAHLVFIFWGGRFSDPAASSGKAQTTDNSNDYNYAHTLQAFRNQYGTAPEYAVITQYYSNTTGTNVNIQTTNLAGNSANNPDWFDTTNPVPNNVTDAAVQAEVQRYLATHPTDYSAIYEVVLPASNASGLVYSSSGTSDSCGGPNLSYCAYHSHYNDGTGQPVKYSIEPYPSCSGCWVSGWSDTQNQEHFVCHETREAVTDALGNAWYDRSGNEADDKCAWSPTPFVDSTSGYSYQYEWSNKVSGCVQQ